MIGNHLVKSWSKTLPVLALSSGEAELMSVVRASMEALGLQAIYRDFDSSIDIEILSDATAAIGMVSRLGLGRVRHLAVSDLWVQNKARSGEIAFSKVEGKKNPADLMTKPLDAVATAGHLNRVGVVVLSGRAGIAPKAKANENAEGGP